MAGPDRVASVGTFSKLIAPGLRIGWIAGAPELLAGMPQMKSDGGSSPLLQRAILEFCKLGRITEQTDLARQTYRRHRDHMVAAVRRELPDAAMQVPEGGYYLWLTLPGDIDGDVLAQRALAEGVNVIPGSKFFAGQFVDYPRNQTTPKNNVRLAFSHAGPDEIDEGVTRLARAYAGLRSS
jgi:2-aminoadipate transaminase